jgi:hypothetical protein
MSKLTWDEVGTHKYALGVSKGVVYKFDKTQNKWLGTAWTGLSSVSESPDGGDANDLYADNILYASIRGTEKLGGTIECYDYPDAFDSCIGENELAVGVRIGQQTKDPFCFCYRSEIGESSNPYHSYKLHVVYNCTAAASEKSYETINDSPDTEPMSFDYDSVPVNVTGHKATSSLEIDASKVPSEKMTLLENALYGTDETEAYLPLPDDLLDLIK